MTIAVSQEGESEKIIELNTSHDIYFKDAINIAKDLEKESVHLIVTSPPYWSIKDYGNPEQIGYSDSLADYFEKLNNVWKACIKVLKPGCKIAVNIGDQFLSAKNEYKGVKQVYQSIPIHSMLVNELVSIFSEDIVYLGTIIWSKVSTSNTSGGGRVMGSVYYPRNGYFFINREYIAIFKKVGTDPPAEPLHKQLSRITLEERRTYFKDSWNFNGVKQNLHPAMFPEKLAQDHILSWSNKGDLVLDPMCGSGTTCKMAKLLKRNFIGIDISPDYCKIARQRLRQEILL